MAAFTNRLQIGQRIGATKVQRNDVVNFNSQCDPALPTTLQTQIPVTLKHGLPFAHPRSPTVTSDRWRSLGSLVGNWLRAGYQAFQYFGQYQLAIPFSDHLMEL
jgi:hypothetical protein